MIRAVVRRVAATYDNLPIPEGQAVGAVVVMVLHRVRPVPLRGRRGLHRTAGLASIAAGLALDAWALRERRRRTTGTFQLERPEALVTTGPYALSRNPMYVAAWLIHLGLGLVRGTAWVAATLPAAVLVEHFGVLAEERALDREFGTEFAAYRRRVPRYLARWGRTTAAAARPTS